MTFCILVSEISVIVRNGLKFINTCDIISYHRKGDFNCEVYYATECKLSLEDKTYHLTGGSYTFNVKYLD